MIQYYIVCIIIARTGGPCNSICVSIQDTPPASPYSTHAQLPLFTFTPPQPSPRGLRHRQQPRPRTRGRASATERGGIFRLPQAVTGSGRGCKRRRWAGGQGAGRERGAVGLAQSYAVAGGWAEGVKVAAAGEPWHTPSTCTSIFPRLFECICCCLVVRRYRVMRPNCHDNEYRNNQ